MKTKFFLRAFIVTVTAMLFSLSGNCQIMDSYSVKNRWTVKASIAGYKTAFYRDVFAFVGDNFTAKKNRRMANFKVEANYGINKFIELGIFTGFQHYEYSNSVIATVNLKKSFAPLFGVNANFHVLPFFVTSKSCHWDLYLTTKYGGCYLPHKELDTPEFEYPYGKYRQEYGLGLGVGYYFKNIVGIFAEGSVGQYFYFNKMLIMMADLPATNYVNIPDYQESNFSFRIGIATKF